jgi:hypothetical protein
MADPNFAKVRCLLDFAGTNGSTNIIDLSPQNNIITSVNGAAISTAESQFGAGSSLSLNGTNQYITLPIRLNLRDNFTIECGIKLSNVASNGAIFSSAAASFAYLVYTGGSMYLGDGGSNAIATTHGLTNNTWHHIAVTFDGTTYRYFVDGILLQSSTSILAGKDTTILEIGARSAISYYFGGNIDNFKFSDDCLYTANFTPPSAAHDDNNGTLTGTITESLDVTNWRVSAIKISDGKYNGSTLSGEGGSSYTVRCIYAEASTIHIEPKIDGIWEASTAIAADEYRVPTNLAAYPHLLKATSIGSAPHQTSGTEPTWSGSGPWTDGDITWTKIATLDDGMFKTLGPNMPA